MRDVAGKCILHSPGYACMAELLCLKCSGNSKQRCCLLQQQHACMLPLATFDHACRQVMGILQSSSHPNAVRVMQVITGWASSKNIII